MQHGTRVSSCSCALNLCNYPCVKETHVHEKAPQLAHQSEDPPQQQANVGSRRNGNLQKEGGGQRLAWALQSRSSDRERRPCPRVGPPVPRLLHCHPCRSDSPRQQLQAFAPLPVSGRRAGVSGRAPNAPAKHSDPTRREGSCRSRSLTQAGGTEGCPRPAPGRGAGAPHGVSPEGRGSNHPAAREGPPRSTPCPRGLLGHPGEPLPTPAANSATDSEEKPLPPPETAGPRYPRRLPAGDGAGGHRRAPAAAALPAPLSPAACGFAPPPCPTQAPGPADLPGGGGGRRGAAPPGRGAPRPGRAAPLPPCLRRARSRRPPRRGAARRRAGGGGGPGRVAVAGGAVGAGPGPLPPAAPGAAPGLARRRRGWRWRGRPVAARALTLPRLPPPLSGWGGPPGA